MIINQNEQFISINFNGFTETNLDKKQNSQIVKLFDEKGLIEFKNLPWKKEGIQDFTDYFTLEYANDATRRTKKYEKKNINSVDTGFNEIPLHSEASFTSVYPELIWFYCNKNDEVSAPTAICDGKILWQSLEKETKKFFLKNPIKFQLEIEIPFADSQKKEQEWFIEEIGASNAVLDWSNGILKMDFVKFVLNYHKKDNYICFANHILIGSEYEKQIKNMSLINGSKIPNSILEEISLKSKENTFNYNWDTDVLLMVDNKRYMHGRKKLTEYSLREILNIQTLKTNF